MKNALLLNVQMETKLIIIVYTIYIRLTTITIQNMLFKCFLSNFCHLKFFIEFEPLSLFKIHLQRDKTIYSKRLTK